MIWCSEIYVGKTLNLALALNFGEILREFGEILGKYRILDGRSVGSKGLRLVLFQFSDLGVMTL